MKNVLITGANSGFGRLMAETLAQKGHTVFAGARDTEGRNAGVAKEMRAKARDAGWKLHVLDLDVTSDASVRAAVDRALAAAGHLDVAVNNAGIAATGLSEAYTDEQVRAVFETDLFGAQRVCRAVLPGMRARGDGLLVAVSTTMTHVIFPYSAFYVGAKCALATLAECYRYELAPLGIDSVIVEPGPFPTPAWGKLMAPADAARLQSYGPLAEAPGKMMAGIGAMLQGPGAPNPQLVADAVLALIETPAGSRPLRTIIDFATGDAARAITGTAAAVQEQVMKGFGMAELMSVRPRS